MYPLRKIKQAFHDLVTEFRMYRASLRVAKRLCKQSANSDTKVCKEFLSLVSDTTKNANGGSDNEDEGTTPSLGVNENSEGNEHYVHFALNRTVGVS